MPINILPDHYELPFRLLAQLGVLSEKPDELEVLQMWDRVRNDQIFLGPRIEAFRAGESYNRTIFEDFALLSAEQKDELRARVLAKSPRRVTPV